MRTRLIPSSVCRRRGATLVEVMAGLVVLGVIVASITVARGRALRQWKDAQTRLEVVRALDTLVAQWMDLTNAVPVRAEGPLPGAPRCYWRTRRLRDAEAEKIGGYIVRVEVLERTARTPVTTLDLLVREYRPPATQPVEKKAGEP